ncbi:hypothetical protein NQD34_002719 [Periophthalmus magnuspinnatus]|nr:hypothetical protein NQD34_002719 [Periophthalmus magnuspinnatus]
MSIQDESFYTQCRAAYLSVFKSSLANISSKQQLCRVLQQAGINPSQAILNKYWTGKTSKLNFDDFCEILKNENKTDENELLKAFRKLDANNDGFIAHSELEKALTSRGEKMTTEEINAIFSLADVNKDGKLDYAEFCRLCVSTVEQCQMAALERLEADAKLKRQNFGSQSYSPPKNPAAPVCSTEGPALETSQASFADSTAKKDSRSSSRSSSARSRRSSVSNAITMTSSSSKISKVQEPSGLQKTAPSLCSELTVEMERARHRLYQMCAWRLPPQELLYVTVMLPEADNWAGVVGIAFKFVWRGELSAGTYHLLPFTSGCRLKKNSKKNTFHKPKELVYQTDTGELDLSRELRLVLIPSLEVLSDIFEMIDLDGNGLLSLDEYNFFELRTSGEKCDKEAWAVCKENFDMRSNQLTRQGFMELNLMEVTEKEGDPTDLWATLEAMGYNRLLQLVEACPFQIDVLCEGAQPQLLPIRLDSGTKLLHQAVHKSVTASAQPRSLRGNDSVLIHTYKGEHRISSLITNKTNQKVTVHVNNEQNKNCCSSRGMDVFAVEIPERTQDEGGWGWRETGGRGRQREDEGGGGRLREAEGGGGRKREAEEGGGRLRENEGG